PNSFNPRTRLAARRCGRKPICSALLINQVFLAPLGLTSVTFLPTHPPLAKALAERNYNEPTPVQAAVLADDAASRDLL
ncbi:hypothetical protein, partial [Serratia marcescens]|uniref:hypothetical protein n=1 Tax=Serratia marcescens TaxID=615 RepID=UPI001952FC75